MTTAPKPVILCILDGWGYRPETENNAIALAETPTFDRLWRTAPHAFVKTSAGDVGLPDGQMGNSEVGHMNIGAGRVMLQDLPRIDSAIAQDILKDEPALTAFLGKLKPGAAVHLMGLVSPGGVHSHQDHLIALARAVDAAGFPVRLHAFMDGRDTAPRSGRAYLAAVTDALTTLADAKIATVSGRFYGMDRDTRWERVARAYAAIVHGQGAAADTPDAAMAASYGAEVTDEFVEPAVIGGYAGVRPGDGLLHGNFRADRVRQLLTALVDPAFDSFDRRGLVAWGGALGMVSYAAALDDRVPAIFPPEAIGDTLGETISAAGLRQLRIAETEKYPHVTYFLNAGTETVFAGEDRIMVPSPKVATYDLAPAMSAVEVTDKLVAAVESGAYDLIVVNYANTDMVGHTGILDAAIKAVETVDGCLARLEAALDTAGGVMLVTADHGNAETMVDPESGEAHTQHTTNAVPLLAVGRAGRNLTLRDGRLADLAPTVLRLMALPQPTAMTGTCLAEVAADAQLSA